MLINNLFGVFGFLFAGVIVVHYVAWKFGFYPKRYIENAKYTQLGLMSGLGLYILIVEAATRFF